MVMIKIAIIINLFQLCVRYFKINQKVIYCLATIQFTPDTFFLPGIYLRFWLLTGKNGYMWEGRSAPRKTLRLPHR